MNGSRLYRIAIADGTRVFACDGVDFEGKVWVVLEWAISADERGWKSPERMICIDNLPHQSLPPDNPFGVDFAVNTALPKAILDGSDEDPQASGYVVCLRPSIRFEVGAESPSSEESAKSQ